MLLVVVLVVLLCPPEGWRRRDDLGHDGSLTVCPGIDLFLHPFLDLLDFLWLIAKHHGTILAALVWPLSICSSRVVDFEEELNQVSVADNFRIVVNFHGFCVTGLASTDLFVGGVVLLASHVTGDDIDDAIEARKAILHSPESAATKPGTCLRNRIFSRPWGFTGNLLPLADETK